jgi:hypothetical protein
MDAKDAIAKLKNDLSVVRNDGRKTVHIEALQAYLADLERDACASLELQKLGFQGTLAQYDATSKSNLEAFRTVVEASREALNASLLINGGAVVAILSFLGATVGKGSASASLGLALTLPLLAFGSGVLAAALSFGTRYVAQYFYGLKRALFAGSFHIFTVALAVGAYGSFGIGVYKSYLAFSAYFASAP